MKKDGVYESGKFFEGYGDSDERVDPYIIIKGQNQYKTTPILKNIYDSGHVEWDLLIIQNKPNSEMLDLLLIDTENEYYLRVDNEYRIGTGLTEVSKVSINSFVKHLGINVSFDFTKSPEGSYYEIIIPK